MTRRAAPYKPGDHLHVLTLHPEHGTGLLPVTVTKITRNAIGGSGRWLVSWTHPATEGVARVNDRGDGDYAQRRVAGCLKCVVSGRVQDGTAHPIEGVTA